ncbi:hypothetical protein BDQ17DRAFT_1424725 [Cyathus striatus]|nr:hypothetical protein BDQ17DRAFT_1424725 [Cyathus striatus]
MVRIDKDPSDDTCPDYRDEDREEERLLLMGDTERPVMTEDEAVEKLEKIWQIKHQKRVVAWSTSQPRSNDERGDEHGDEQEDIPENEGEERREQQRDGPDKNHQVEVRRNIDTRGQSEVTHVKAKKGKSFVFNPN